MDKQTAERILKETESGYDLIAEKFSQTRKHFWSELEFIKKYINPNDKVLDFGCGNGRLFPFLKEKADIKYQGVDVSEKLIEIAKIQHGQDLEFCHPAPDAGSRSKFESSEILDSRSPIVAEDKLHGNDKSSVCFQKIDPNQTSLAFQDNFFNAIYSIAVFHHIPSEKVRADYAKEFFRITKKDGYVIVTVWNLWPSFASLWRGKPASTRGDNRLSTRGGQKKYFLNIFKNWKNKIFDKIIRMSGIRSAGSRRDSELNNLDWNDCYISFTDNQNNKFQRFHRAFTKRELRRLFENAGFKTEKCEIIGSRNIVYIGKKK